MYKVLMRRSVAIIAADKRRWCNPCLIDSRSVVDSCPRRIELSGWAPLLEDHIDIETVIMVIKVENCVGYWLQSHLIIIDEVSVVMPRIKYAIGLIINSCKIIKTSNNHNYCNFNNVLHNSQLAMINFVSVERSINYD